MKISLTIVIFFALASCNSVRDSAGVNRKAIDEYSVIENPPLVIPPNFNLLPPEQIESRKIEDTNTDLAKEILFGLDDTETQNIENSSLIDEIIRETKANEVEDTIRVNIDEEFAGQKTSINDETIFQSEEDLNKAIIETENKLKNNKNNKKAKVKKKKRFFFF